MSSLISANRELSEMINGGSWNLSWFISTGVSNHQRGGAMDVSLLKLSGEEEYDVTGGYSYLRIDTPDYYDMPTPIHELSTNAVTYTYPISSESETAWQTSKLSPGMLGKPAAQNLQKYCTDAGLTPLASEWWHFNDLGTLRRLSDKYGGDFVLTECYSIPPK